MNPQDSYKLAKTDLGQQRKQKMGRRPSKMVCSAYAGLYALECLEAWLHALFTHCLPLKWEVQVQL